ncbi:DUF11 domain-containing protein [Agitococcus lubricus]|uniref:Putative repeat protein (TIGR01451 family) n=1 Tax=Agitococcus lubricus TaxID=1077255 RepID=A0A2T5J3F9_9GAMM|nr:DUF11 domain-containing protein [Agitococcus lubricus]PTQ91154.1 putative repeat protein (TIGR01451 family) [Agitococcus lubricus]
MMDLRSCQGFIRRYFDWTRYYKQRYWQCVLFCLLSLPFSSVMANDIGLSMRAEKSVSTIENGQPVLKLVPATRIKKGDILTITIRYQNLSDTLAANIRIDNPIPAGAHFINGSGFGANAIVLVSYDQGQSFEDDIHVRKEPVTHVRWDIDSLAGNASGEVGFKLQIDDERVNFNR